MKHRLHVVTLPYLPTSRNYPACAFTSRVEKFCQMMYDAGSEVIHYGVEGGKAVCSEHVSVVSQEQRHGWFGKYDPSKVCYAEKGVKWCPSEDYWRVFNLKAAGEISQRLRKKDLVCIIGGSCQSELISHLKPQSGLFQTVEFGIGYLGTFAARRVFDSYAHMHHLYGRESSTLVNGRDGENFDAVIPCPYRIEEFPLRKIGLDYCLFIGRITKRKGLHAAVSATKLAGCRLIIAGQGIVSTDNNRLHADDGQVYEGKHLEHVGHVGQQEKIKLISGARAVLVPSEYLEPFGGVNVEAQLCGVPAITTDFGAFPETVEHGISGYRCRTLEQFVWAVKNAHSLNSQVIRSRARALWSMERVSRMYQEYFDMLGTLWGSGWYATKAHTRANLNWLSPMGGE